jgi:hypothetical protein
VAQVPETVLQAPEPPLTGCDAVRAEIAKYRGWDTTIMTAVSKGESNCNTQAKGDTTLTYENNGRVYGYSVGVLQVRILEGREHCDSYDLSVNVKCAYEIWQRQGMKAWTVYNSGKYKKFLN